MTISKYPVFLLNDKKPNSGESKTHQMICLGPTENLLQECKAQPPNPKCTEHFVWITIVS